MLKTSSKDLVDNLDHFKDFENENYYNIRTFKNTIFQAAPEISGDFKLVSGSYAIGEKAA